MKIKTNMKIKINKTKLSSSLLLDLAEEAAGDLSNERVNLYFGGYKEDGPWGRFEGWKIARWLFRPIIRVWCPETEEDIFCVLAHEFGHLKQYLNGDDKTHTYGELELGAEMYAQEKVRFWERNKKTPFRINSRREWKSDSTR